MQLEPLCINKQKDQIIARLILQKFDLYLELVDQGVDCGYDISKGELYHVMTFAIRSDREAYKEVWGELETAYYIL